MKWYLKMFKQLFVFKGRTRRSEYWLFHLLHIPTIIFLIIILVIIIGTPLYYISPTTEYQNRLFTLLSILCIGLIIIFCIIPSIAITVRRLHDIGMSGWMFLLAFAPFGNIILLIFMLRDSEPGLNRWGKNPKGIKAFYDNDVEQK